MRVVKHCPRLPGEVINAIPGQAGQGVEQSGLVESVPTNCKGI